MLLMGVSFYYHILPEKSPPSFEAGTSSDVDVLQRYFNNEVCAKDMDKLSAMHAATGLEKSLWGEIYKTLERLQGGNYEKVVRLSVWPEY
jgi:hypothetical protein